MNPQDKWLKKDKGHRTRRRYGTPRLTGDGKTGYIFTTLAAEGPF